MRAIIALCLMLAGGVASAQSEAQASLMCGTVACAPHINAVFSVGTVTGIDDLKVGGDYFDVSFTTTAPASSPFVLSSTTAAPGEPLTGVDAGDAIGAVYASLQPPYGDYNIAGDAGPAFITAFAPSGKLSSAYFGATALWDVAETFVGGDYYRTPIFGNNGYGPSGSLVDNGGNEVYYTKWTQLAAPEVDASFAGSELALLIGALAVLRGRKA